MEWNENIVFTVKGVPEGSNECHRHACYSAVLHLTRVGRIKQERRTVSERPTHRPDLPDYAHPQDSEVGPPFHWTAVVRIHAAAELQGTGTSHDVSCYWHPRLLQSGVLRGEGPRQDQVRQHPRYILVGGNHHDNCRLRRHVPKNAVGKGIHHSLYCTTVT